MPADQIATIYDRYGSELSLVERAMGGDLPERKADIQALEPSLYANGAEETTSAGGIYGQSRRSLRIDGSIDAINALALPNATVAACVNTIAPAMMRRGWELRPALGPDGNEISNPDESDGELLHEWYAHCHPYMSIEQILGATLAGFVQTGRYFLAIAYNGIRNDRTEYGRQPGRIDPLIPQGSIRALIDEHGDFKKPGWAQVRKDKKPIYFDWEEILWLQYPNLVRSGIFPMSPVEQAQMPIRTGNQAETFAYSFFTSGGKMGIVVRIPKATANAKTVALETKKSLERAFGNPEQGFRIITLIDGMELEDSPDSGEKKMLTMDEVGKEKRDAICSVFGVDPRLIGADKGGNFGGKGEREQAWNELIVNAVLPRVKFFEAAWNNQLHVQGFGITHWLLRLKPEKLNASEEAREAVTRIYKGAAELGAVDTARLEDLNAIRAEVNPELPPLEATPSRQTIREQYQYDYQAGIVSINEARAQKGLPPIPGGEALLAMAELVPQQRGARALSPWAARFDVRAATKLLDGIEDDLAGELGSGLRKVAATLTVTLSKAYAAGDLKAVKKLDNWAPGGGELIKIGSRLWKKFYTDSQAMARAEIKAAVKQARALTEDAIADGGPGDIADFIDLANMDFFDDLFGDLKSIGLKTFKEGLAAGWSRKDFIAKLGDKFTYLEETELSTAIRTQSTDFFNLARQQIFNASDGLVESVEFAAILDDRTTEVCEKLDGTVFRGMDDPNLDTARPPLHYNCRSVILPIVQGDEWKPTSQREVQGGLRLIHSGFGKRAFVGRCSRHAA